MMKNISRISTVLLLFSVILGACSPQPSQSDITVGTSIPASENSPAKTESDVLYLNLVWHQHQPLYYNDANGVYTRPWVRVHATKDYYDMAATIEKYPQVHATVNLTPVLIRQLDDFVNNGAKDYYWVLSEIPAEELTLEQKDFILRRFLKKMSPPIGSSSARPDLTVCCKPFSRIRRPDRPMRFFWPIMAG